MASHELKTPVTAIKTYSEILEESLQQSGEHDGLQMVKKMNGQVDRLISLMQNLLDSSNLSEGRIRLNREVLDLNEVAGDALEMLKPVTAQHTVAWKPQPLSMINADRQRLIQVITNLVSNAVKYSPEGTEIVIATQHQEGHAFLSVTDHGMGIPVDIQQFVFERYYRGQHAPGSKGFGLGLYICSAIIKQHHGTIGLTSVPGEGSTFYFSLPFS